MNTPDKIRDEHILTVLEEEVSKKEPMLSAKDVYEHLNDRYRFDTTREYISNRLRKLEEDGKVIGKKFGHAGKGWMVEPTNLDYMNRGSEHIQ